MDTVGIFDAKTRLSELCDTVDREGRAILITRRGRPVARLVPVDEVSRGASVWEARSAFVARKGLLEDDLALPARALDARPDALG